MTFDYFGRSYELRDDHELIEENNYALFVDVMGVQEKLAGGDEETRNTGFYSAIEMLGQFHRDLNSVVNMSVSLILAEEFDTPISFVAEFSDSAYIVSKEFTPIAVAGIALFQKAIRHNYPIRGGVGYGKFFHQMSGVKAHFGNQTWSTSAFLGDSIVTAYRAERNAAPGMRVFIHPSVPLPQGTAYVTPLEEQESNENANSELRLWDSTEIQYVLPRLIEFKEAQDLSERATEHYNATMAAYQRFLEIKERLPHIPPNYWL